MNGEAQHIIGQNLVYDLIMQLNVGKGYRFPVSQLLSIARVLFFSVILSSSMYYKLMVAPYSLFINPGQRLCISLCILNYALVVNIRMEMKDDTHEQAHRRTLTGRHIEG